MSFEIKHAVIHGFTKKVATTNVSSVVKKRVLLDVDKPAVFALVKEVNGLLGKPGNILSYGQFADDMRQGEFPAGFGEYVPKRDDAAEFLSLSHLAVDELVELAAQQPFATGGHILVSAYESEGRPFLLVAMIKERGGIVLDEDYVPVEILEIDLSKVHQAARINVERYLQVMDLPVEALDNEEAVQEDRTYLSFLGARADNQAAAYFVRALGCTKGLGSSRATNNVLEAVKGFFSRPELKHHKADARNAVIVYLQEKAESRQDAQLTEIAHCATACLKANQEEFLEAFKVYLNSDDAKVPAAFAVHASTVKKASRIKVDAPGWTAQFERRVLGETPNSPIYFNAETRSLTFTGLDDATIREITAELDLR